MSTAMKSTTSLKKRLISGFTLGPLTCAVILLGGWYFLVMVVLAVLLGLFEWYKLARLCDKTSDQYLTLIPGMFYLMFSAMSFIFLRFGFEQGGWLVLSLILCVWASDIGAYFVGKKIGGAKLFPAISPKKTWSGFAGAVICCGLALFALVIIGNMLEPHITFNVGIHGFQTGFVFLAGCFLGAAGQAGDLLISFFKRRVQVKDTGDLIPGHGGLLDRIDSLLLVSPIFLLFVVLWL